MENYDKNIDLLKEGTKESLNKFAELNFPLVSSISKKFLNRGYEYEEIFQIGCLGLTRAINKFNFDYNVKFSTYAYPMITGEIRRFLRDDGIIRVSRSLKATFKHMCFAHQKFIKKLGRKPTIKELSDCLNITEQDIKDAYKMYNTTNPDSLERVVYNNGDHDPILLKDYLSSDSNLEEEAIQNIDLQNAVNSLPEEQKQIIILKLQEYTQLQIGEILGIQQVKVSRLERKAYIKLKEYLGSDKLSKKEEALKLFRQGLNTKEVMKELGITKSTANTYKSFYNKECNSLEMQKKMFVFKMFSQKFSNDAIAKRTGVMMSKIIDYKSEFEFIKNTAFKMLDKGKSESEISKKLNIEESLVHNLRHDWATTPIKPENKISTGKAIVKIKPVEENPKNEIKVQKPIETVKESIKEPEQPIQEIKKENKEEIYMLKPLLLKGEFAKYDLQEEGKIKVICDKELTLNSEQVDLFVQELEQAKKAI